MTSQFKLTKFQILCYYCDKLQFICHSPVFRVPSLVHRTFYVVALFSFTHLKFPCTFVYLAAAWIVFTTLVVLTMTLVFISFKHNKHLTIFRVILDLVSPSFAIWAIYWHFLWLTKPFKTRFRLFILDTDLVRPLLSDTAARQLLQARQYLP